LSRRQKEKSLHAESIVRKEDMEIHGLPCFRPENSFRDCTMTTSSRPRRIDGAENERCPQASLSEPDIRPAAGHTAEIHKCLSAGQMPKGFTGIPEIPDIV